MPCLGLRELLLLLGRSPRHLPAHTLHHHLPVSPSPAPAPAPACCRLSCPVPRLPPLMPCPAAGAPGGQLPAPGALVFSPHTCMHATAYMCTHGYACTHAGTRIYALSLDFTGHGLASSTLARTCMPTRTCTLMHTHAQACIHMRTQLRGLEQQQEAPSAPVPSPPLLPLPRCPLPHHGFSGCFFSAFLHAQEEVADRGREAKVRPVSPVL